MEAFASRNVDGRLLLQLGADSAWVTCRLCVGHCKSRMLVQTMTVMILHRVVLTWQAELGVTDPAQQRVLDSAVEPLR